MRETPESPRANGARGQLLQRPWLAMLCLVALAALAVPGRAVDAAPRTDALTVRSTTTLAEVYAYLGVAPPGPRPAMAPEACSADWVAWDDNSGSIPASEEFCIGRWRARRSIQCRDPGRCGCETFNTCNSGRRYVDACESESDCLATLYRGNVASSQVPSMTLACSQSARTAAQRAADHGPYYYRWQVDRDAQANFICNAYFAAAGPRQVQETVCGCQTANQCECSSAPMQTLPGLTAAEGARALQNSLSANDELADVTCETLQDEDLSPPARLTALRAAHNATTDATSRAAFEQTERLMNELALVEVASDGLVDSGLVAPSCGRQAWMRARASCVAAIDSELLQGPENCSRLLGEHVAPATLSPLDGTPGETVLDECFRRLQALEAQSFEDPACAAEVGDDVAYLGCRLYAKALGSDPSICN